ncbi:DNA cytosine methyltransferase [Macrococcus animalis]|uniref:DNA cytosine methyltransferase n=1 Tax=Macrococcus animalis TaxID=3395467 RepID=UPI0039BE6249
MKYKVIDLFSGVGGFSRGFIENDFEVLLAVEYDKNIAYSYKKNHPHTEVLNEDITTIDIKSVFEKYKNIDVIIGGPPCQGFSQKGNRKIIDDERNYLFRKFNEIVSFVKPKFFVIENVPNIITANQGSFINEIISYYDDIDYKVSYKVLNASDYGVPQNRKRAFIIGTKGESTFSFPAENVERVSAWEAISDLSFLESGEGSFEQTYSLDPKSKFQINMRKNSLILYNHISTNHSKSAIEKLKMIPENGDMRDLPKLLRTKSIYSGTWGRIFKNKASVTITTRFDTPSSGRFTHPELNRAITVREAARLQGFSDDFIFWGSKSSQMKQVGNAVPPLLSKVIASKIKDYLERGIK